MRPTIPTILAVFLAAPLVRADVLHLKNGRVIEGTVVAQTEREVRLQTPGGRIVIPMQVIARVERCDPPEVELGDRIALADLQDPAAVEALALWASSRGLGDAARDLLALSRGLRLERLVERARTLDDADEFLAAFHWARTNEASDEVLDWLLAEARARDPRSPALRTALADRRNDLAARRRAEQLRQERLSHPRYLDPEQAQRYQAALGQDVTARPPRDDPRRAADFMERARAAVAARASARPAAPATPASD